MTDSMRVVGLAACLFLMACKSSDCSARRDDAVDDAAPREEATCALADLPKIQWPLRGAVSRDYAITAYTDDDPSPGKRDFMGYTGDEAITYDGHDGIDIDIGGFERMDAGVSVYAGLDAVVQSAEDGAPDRNTGTTPPEQKKRANFIILRPQWLHRRLLAFAERLRARETRGRRATRSEDRRSRELGRIVGSAPPHRHL